MFSDSFEELLWFSIAKGIFFVGSTSLLFYLFCRKWQRYVEELEVDIVEHKQEAESDESKYKSVFDVANDALFIVDSESLRFLEVNETASLMYGYSMEEFYDKLIVLDLSAQVEASKSALEAETSRIEYRLHKKSDGRVFPVDITMTFFKLKDRKTIAVSVRDMTTHSELVKKLKRSEQRYINAQIMGNVGSWNHDLKLNVVMWSPGLCRIFGIDDTVQPTSENEYFEMIHPEDREEVKEKIKRLYENFQPAFWECRIFRPNGEMRYLMSQCVIVVDENGVPVELVGTDADITDRKIAENEILKFNHELEVRVEERTKELMISISEKDEILSIAAHDLRNPLGGILLQSGLIKMYYEKGRIEEARVRIAEIEKSVERMNDIITNLLNTHALESGKYTIELSTFDSQDIIQNAVDMFQEQALLKSIQIHWEKKNCMSVYADSKAFLDVIENLISNAIKYSQYEKNIWINTEYQNSKVRVSIKDEGPGIADEEKSKLFKKFGRLSAQPTGGESSTGLGLSIVKKLVEAMNGNVWVDSSVGQGATFVVELPVSIELERATNYANN